MFPWFRFHVSTDLIWLRCDSEPVVSHATHCLGLIWGFHDNSQQSSIPPYLRPSLDGRNFTFFLSRCLLVCIHLTFNFHNFPVLTSHQNSPLQSQVFSFTFLILITNQAGFHYIILLPTFMPRNWASTIQRTQPTHGDHISNKQTLTSKKACTQCNVKSSLKVWLHIKILFDNPQHHHSPLLTSWPDKVRKLENVISVQMLRTMQKLNSCNCSNISGFTQRVDFMSDGS